MNAKSSSPKNKCFAFIERFEGLIGVVVGALLTFVSQLLFYNYQTQTQQLDFLFQKELTYFSDVKNCTRNLLYQTESLFNETINESFRVKAYIDYLHECSMSIQKLKLSSISLDLLDSRKLSQQFDRCLPGNYSRLIDTLNVSELNGDPVVFVEEYVLPIIDCKEDVFLGLNKEIESSVTKLH